MAAKKPEVLLLEIADQAPSGFYRDGTKGTAEEQQLTAPSIMWIPAESYKCEIDPQTGLKKNVKIRYISNCDEIDPLVQEKMGYKPNTKEDKILLKAGINAIVESESTIGLYRYLKASFFNASNANRSDKATPLYREVNITKTAEEFNDLDELRHEAEAYLFKLRVKKGDKAYMYNEDKLAAICSLFNVSGQADEPSTRFVALMAIAKAKPKEFLDQVATLENVVSNEVAYALQLNVIRFDGNTALFTDSKSVIANLGEGKLKEANKIELLSVFLQGQEASGVLTELRSKINLAKEKSLS